MCYGTFTEQLCLDIHEAQRPYGGGNFVFQPENDSNIVNIYSKRKATTQQHKNDEMSLSEFWSQFIDHLIR